MSGSLDDVDFDQDWFFKELDVEADTSNTLPNIPVHYDLASPQPTTSTTDHVSHSQSRIQQHQLPSEPLHSNVYQEQQQQQPMGYMDNMMPSTSEYGVQHQQQHIPEPQVSQQQQHHQMQMHQSQQQQQQFETLHTYNPNQGNQVMQAHYQQESIMFDNEMDFIMANEASTSNSMPMECRISQEYVVQQQSQQYHHQPQQPTPQMNNEPQWMSMEPPSQMSQQSGQPQQHMTPVVYTSSSQQMPRIPDPGGNISNQPQIINSYNQQQQLIQTGPNGENILTNMQPVQPIHQQRIITQQHQQFEMNAGGYISQQQIAYIDQSGQQQYMSSQLPDDNQNFRGQPIVQVVQQSMPVQQSVMASEPQPSASQPATKARAKNTPKANGKKKNQQAAQPPPPQPMESSSILQLIACQASQVAGLEVNLSSAHQSAMMGEILTKLSNTEDLAEKAMLEKQLENLLNQAQIAPQAPPSSKPAFNYPPLAPTQPTPPTKGKKRLTKAEQKQQLQQRKMMNAAPQVNNNMPPPAQNPIAPNDFRVVSQNADFILVEVNGAIMKAVMVRAENGTATYQILREATQEEKMSCQQQQGLLPQSSQPQPPPQRRVQPIQPKNETEDASQAAALAAVSDVINSFGSGNSTPAKAKAPKKTPARSKAKKTADQPVIEIKPRLSKAEFKDEPTVICVPSTSREPEKPKIILPAINDLARRIKDKTETRRKKVADFVAKMKESIGTADLESPFIDKEDVFHRLLPYGLYSEPDLSQKAIEKLDLNLERHRIYNEDRHQSIKDKMKNIFVKSVMKQSFDLEINMMIALDIEYERQLLEKDKAAANEDLYSFIRDSDVLRFDHVTPDYITTRKNELNQIRAKVDRKPLKGFVFETTPFDEEAIRRRTERVIEDDKDEARRKEAAAYLKAHPPAPLKPKPEPETPSKPQESTSDTTKVKKQFKSTETVDSSTTESSSSSDASSSDEEEYVQKKTVAKPVKVRPSSPPKERKSKSPQKVQKHATLVKEKLPSSIDSQNTKNQPPIKTTIRRTPPENPYYSSMNLGDFKIPKIGEAPSVQAHKRILTGPPKLEAVPVQQLQSRSQEQVFKIPQSKPKEPVVEPLKLKKALYSEPKTSFESERKDKDLEPHHHRHHHHSKHADKPRSSSAVSDRVNQPPLPTKSNERSQSLNRPSEIQKVPSLVLPLKKSVDKKPEDKSVKEKEKSIAKEKERESPNVIFKVPAIPIAKLKKPVTEPVKAEQPSSESKSNIPPSKLDTKDPKSLKLKILLNKSNESQQNFSNTIKPAVPSSLSKQEPKKEVIPKEPEKLKIKLSNIPKPPEPEKDAGLISEEAEKEAKQKRKEEKKKRKAVKEQRKLEKRIRKQKEEEEAAQATIFSSQLSSQPSSGGLKLKIKPLQPPAPTPPPPLSLKITIARPHPPSDNEGKKKHKRESSKADNRSETATPPPKIPRVTIKLGNPGNGTSPSTSSTKNHKSRSEADSDRPPKLSKEENSSQQPYPQQPTTSKSRDSSQDPFKAPENKKMKKTSEDFSDSSDTEEPKQPNLLFMTASVLSRCRPDQRM